MAEAHKRQKERLQAVEKDAETGTRRLEAAVSARIAEIADTVTRMDRRVRPFENRLKLESPVVL